MAVFDNLSGKLRTVFDEGLDEVLIFAIIFILILLSEKNENNMGILPVVIIGVFLLVFVGICRTDEPAA
jgi:hypothetical protein